MGALQLKPELASERVVHDEEEATLAALLPLLPTSAIWDLLNSIGIYDGQSQAEQGSSTQKIKCAKPGHSEMLSDQSEKQLLEGVERALKAELAYRNNRKKAVV